MTELLQLNQTVDATADLTQFVALHARGTRCLPYELGLKNRAVRLEVLGTDQLSTTGTGPPPQGRPESSTSRSLWRLRELEEDEGSLLLVYSSTRNWRTGWPITAFTFNQR